MGDWALLGDRAVRFARPVGPSARAIMRAVRAWPGVVDVVVAQYDVAAYFNHSPAIDAARIRALAGVEDDASPIRDIELRAVYDGPDLDEIARFARTTMNEVAQIHRDATYTVETIGFAPGFAYMSGLDARLRLPRRATPRLRVPSSSIAIAGEHTGVYPFDSSGGWHLIGRVVGARMFGPEGSLLRLGDHVRFVPC